STAAARPECRISLTHSHSHTYLHLRICIRHRCAHPSIINRTHRPPTYLHTYVDQVSIPSQNKTKRCATSVSSCTRCAGARTRAQKRSSTPAPPPARAASASPRTPCPTRAPTPAAPPPACWPTTASSPSCSASSVSRRPRTRAAGAAAASSLRPFGRVLLPLRTTRTKTRTTKRRRGSR
ncbi:hypothetical protein F4780DRAFT_786048, partial [Xylariomycetidae sp. FL0641]